MCGKIRNLALTTKIWGQDKSENLRAEMISEAERSGVPSVENGPHDLLEGICYKSVKRAPLTHAYVPLSHTQ